MLGTTAGGSTFMVTLPKGWVQVLGLKKGNELTLNRVGSGIYLYHSKAATATSISTQLELGDALQGEGLARTLISRYIAGFDVIEVLGEISIEQRQTVRHTVQQLIGAEILQETADFSLIHILRDPQVLSVSQLLGYIFDNVSGMLHDGPASLLEADLDKALSVIQRDERVDRFFLLLSRRLYSALRDPLAEVSQQISRVDFFNDHTVARQLERIADHAVKIAQVAQVLAEAQRRLPEPLADVLAQANQCVQTLIERVMKAYEDFDAKEAHCALEAAPQVEQLVRAFDQQLLTLDDSHLAYHLGIVADSINRVKDYAVNIGELALNAEALRRA